MTKTNAGRELKTVTDVTSLLAEEPRLSAHAETIRGSTILQIAADIREMLERGERVLNLTVGDFRPDQFPVPKRLVACIIEAYRAGQTNYPPVAGVKELREAIRETVREDLGLEYPLEATLVTGGARPLIYATYTAVVDPGDPVLYPVPSWNNHHYCQLSGATGVPLPVTAAKNFHLDRTDIEPYLGRARLLCLNSPLNPTGTCISRDALAGICEAIVLENGRRRTIGERPFFLLYDQVYHTLTFGDVEHHTPVGLVPEIAPYTLMLDAVSKAFSGTGLRVGWGVGPPTLIKKMSAMAGHYGAWAPRPGQMGTAAFLRDRPAVLAHRAEMLARLDARLGALHVGFTRMREAGLPVDHIEPQGAIYLSVRFPLIGKEFAGRPIDSGEDIRSLLLHEAGFAVVPFEAFGLADQDGWVRASVGAVSVEEIEEGLARIEALLERVH